MTSAFLFKGKSEPLLWFGIDFFFFVIQRTPTLNCIRSQSIFRIIFMLVVFEVELAINVGF